MPLVIFDGPEAAGKSTIIDALSTEWGVGKAGLRTWGPRESWLEYCQPLFEDLKYCKENPTLLVIWSRCWASRTVYNKLLNQGQIIPPEVTRELDRIVIRSGGLLYMVTSPERVLLERRMARLASGSTQQDHQLNVHQELTEFQRYARDRQWIDMSGTTEVETNVRAVIHTLVRRNPECRMDVREAVDMAH